MRSVMSPRLKFTLRRSLEILLAAILIGLSLQSVSAQGLIETPRGGAIIPPARELPPRITTYAAPLSLSAPLVPAQAGELKFTREIGGPAYCVRLCDGRYFPLARNAAVSLADACRSFCPAARTKVFFGTTINQATAADGSRYASLDTALLYRTRLVDNCTCNGRDARGVARLNVAKDPTLRNGDIVAGNNGFAAYGYRGFTLIAQANVPGEVRGRLAETRIYAVPQAEAVPARIVSEKSARREDRRAQLSR
jgi:Protein of unknown function (DUF2865)